MLMINMVNDGLMMVNLVNINGLDYGKIFRKALYLMVKTMVSCKFSLRLVMPMHLHFARASRLQPKGRPPDGGTRLLDRRLGGRSNKGDMWGEGSTYGVYPLVNMVIFHFYPLVNQLWRSKW